MRGSELNQLPITDPTTSLSFLSMTRTSRTRYRDKSISGYYTESDKSGYRHDWPNTQGNTCQCFDSVGRPIVDSPFTSLQESGAMVITGSAISGFHPWEENKKEFHSYPVVAGTSLDTTPTAAPSGWYLDVVAGTNPSRPVVTPPELVQDLIELPAQILESWKLLQNPKILKSGRESANQFLNVKFGWLPFIEDLRQLMDVQALILKRNKELKQLYSGKGLRRRLQFGGGMEFEKRVARLTWYGFGGNYADFHYTAIVRKRQWASIHWKPLLPPPYHPDDEANHRFTRNLVLGLTPEGMAKGLWNVIPWTWMIGWFTNFGKYALAHSLTVPATHSGACFMSEVVQEFIPGPVETVDLQASSLRFVGQRTCTSKTRSVSGALEVGFNLPYLDKSRLSVVAALFAQRTLR